MFIWALVMLCGEVIFREDDLRFFPVNAVHRGHQQRMGAPLMFPHRIGEIFIEETALPPAESGGMVVGPTKIVLQFRVVAASPHDLIAFDSFEMAQRAVVISYICFFPAMVAQGMILCDLFTVVHRRIPPCGIWVR